MVTISRQVGSGGDDIARLLAGELKWSFLDKGSLEKVIVERGFPRIEIDDYDEKKPSLWNRLSVARDRYLHFLRMAVFDFAQKGSCVILGRGGQVLLKEIPGTLHVRVVAPVEDRIRAVQEQLGRNERQARQYVQHHDSEREGFHRYFFGTDCDSFELYDLVINTRILSQRSAVELIKAAARAEEGTASPEDRASKLKQLYLAERVAVAILYEQNLPIASLSVEAADGVITLNGMAYSEQSIERSKEAAAKVSGVKRVVSGISYVPQWVGM